MPLDSALEPRGVRAPHEVNFRAILEEDEGGHGGDGVLLGNVLGFVDVGFGEDDVCVFLRERFVARSYGVAGEFRESVRDGIMLLDWAWVVS